MSRNEEFLRPIEDHGPSPLRYDRTSSAYRYAITDPDVPLPFHQRSSTTRGGLLETEQFAPIIKYTHPERGRTPYKGGPRVERNPNVIEPFTVAFADFHHQAGNGIYIDYLSSRQRGQHHASRLIDALAAQYPEHSLDFGKVMHPAVQHIADRLRERGRTVRTVKYF